MNDSCGSRQDTSSAGSSEAASSEFDFDKNHPSSDEFEDEGEDEEEINIEEVEVWFAKKQFLRKIQNFKDHLPCTKIILFNYIACKFIINKSIKIIIFMEDLTY